MTRNKLRLELALYARPKHPGTYHYALFVSPKSTKRQISGSPTKHHVKNTLQNINGLVSQPWRYECLDIKDVQLEPRILARIIIAKVVVSRDALQGIFDTIPVYQDDDVEVMEGKVFSCRTWVRDALEELGKQNAVVGLTDWDDVQHKALEYVEGRIRMRRWDAEWEGGKGVPMLDLLTREEIVR